jgi:hypothetical protein
MKMKVKRLSAGSYVVGLDGIDPQQHYTVSVKYFPHLKGWVAAATWDRHVYSDPAPTYRDAKRSAAYQLENCAAEELERLSRHV